MFGSLTHCVDSFDTIFNKDATISIAEKCFDIWGIILKMATVKSVKPGNKSFSINQIIRFRSKLLPLGFSKFFPGSDFITKIR